MSVRQMLAFDGLIDSLDEGYGNHALHHGVCVGADVQAAEAVSKRGWYTIGHPGPQSQWRAEWEDDSTFAQEGYLARNRKIVAVTDLLIAAPLSTIPWEHKRTGGTWYTVDHAYEMNHPVVILPR